MDPGADEIFQPAIAVEATAVLSDLSLDIQSARITTFGEKVIDTFYVTDLVGQPFWQVHDRLYRLIEKGFASWANPRRQMLGVLSDLGLPSEILRARATTSHPMQTVSALLPRLPRYDVVRIMACLEAAVGNGFAPVPLTLTWPMLQQMRHDGFTIGSHTRTHVSLPMENAATAERELVESKRALERLGELGMRGWVPHFEKLRRRWGIDAAEAPENTR